MGRKFLVSVGGTLMTFMLCTFSAYAAGTPVLNFTALPATPSSVNPSIRTYFLEQGHAGHTLTESLEITNPNAASITVNAVPVGAETGTNGGIVYGARAASHTWLQMPHQSIAVPAHSTKMLPVDVRIPSNTVPGTYLFGISLQDSKGQAVREQAKSGVAVELNEQVRRVIAVQVQVPGPTQVSFDLNHAAVGSDPSGQYFTVTGLNHSNVIVSGIQGSLTLVKGSKTLHTFPLSNVEFAPQSSISFQERWLGGHADVGQYKVLVDLHGKQFGTYHKVLSFHVTTKALKVYQSLTGDKAVQTIYPKWLKWMWVVLGLLVILVVGLGIKVFRRRHNQREAGV